MFTMSTCVRERYPGFCANERTNHHVHEFRWRSESVCFTRTLSLLHHIISMPLIYLILTLISLIPLNIRTCCFHLLLPDPHPRLAPSSQRSFLNNHEEGTSAHRSLATTVPLKLFFRFDNKQHLFLYLQPSTSTSTSAFFVLRHRQASLRWIFGTRFCEKSIPAARQTVSEGGGGERYAFGGDGADVLAESFEHNRDCNTSYTASPTHDLSQDGF